MKDELIKELLNVINGTKEFVLAQAPDVARQIVLYETWVSVAYIAISLIIISLVWWRVYPVVKLERAKEKYQNIDLLCSCWASIGAFTVILSIVIVINLSTLLKVTLAPKFFLLEFLGGLVK